FRRTRRSPVDPFSCGGSLVQGHKLPSYLHIFIPRLHTPGPIPGSTRDRPPDRPQVDSGIGFLTDPGSPRDRPPGRPRDRPPGRAQRVVPATRYRPRGPCPADQRTRDARPHNPTRKARPPHVRDTRESRLLLVLLIAIAFALITVDIRGGQDSPVEGARQAAATVFGPIENGVSSAVDPVGNAIAAVRDSGSRHDRIAQLEQSNAALKAKLGSDDRNRSRLKQLDNMIRVAGEGQYGIKGAEIIAIGAAQGFSWTVTIDVGAKDGIKRDMTV